MIVPFDIREAMLANAFACHPEESCGLLAVDGAGRLRMAYPLTNSLHSSTNYTIEPTEHFRALKHAEKSGWEIAGVFHSHPHTGSYLSETDVRLAADPEWVHVVIGMEDYDSPTIKAFRIDGGAVEEIPLDFEEKK